MTLRGRGSIRRLFGRQKAPNARVIDHDGPQLPSPQPFASENTKTRVTFASQSCHKRSHSLTNSIPTRLARAIIHSQCYPPSRRPQPYTLSPADQAFMGKYQHTFMFVVHIYVLDYKSAGNHPRNERFWEESEAVDKPTEKVVARTGWGI